MKLDKISNQFESMMHDLPAGKMKHLEVEGKEIAIANINGNYYAFDDRCGHMCAPLSNCIESQF